MSEDDDVSVNMSQDTSVLYLALSSFLNSASKWPKIDVTSKSLVTAVENLSSDKPSRISLQMGVYGDCVIENTASCLFLSEDSLDSVVQVSSVDDENDHTFDEKKMSKLAVFHEPIKIYARAPLTFHSVWFSNIVEVAGEGPVFFSQCMFGASPKCVRSDSSSSPYASVHLFLDGVCMFSECDFGHICGLVDFAGNSEVPAVTACGQTKLKIINCSFLGPGVVSTALALLDSATLEADYMTVVRCGGHGLIVGDKSNAVVLRSVFYSNGGGIWVKENGKLAIRDSSLEMVLNGRSSLLLTDHSRCSVHDTILSSCAVVPELSGRSIVMVRDYAHLSLTSCDLFWVKNTEYNEESKKNQQQSLRSNAVPGREHDCIEDTGLFHVVLREGSKSTLTRCILRLPLMDETDNKCASAGLLLRSVPQTNGLPLYAVENTVLYGYPIDMNTPVLKKEPDLAQLRFMCGLVLPSSTNKDQAKAMQGVTSMWIYSNHFLKSDQKPLKDTSLACSPYDIYCKVTGLLPLPPDTVTNSDLASYRTTSSLSASTWERQLGVTKRSGLDDRNAPGTDLCSTMGKSPPQVDDTCSRKSFNERRSNSRLANSSATSLTFFSDDDNESNKDAVKRPPPLPLTASPPLSPKQEKGKGRENEKKIEGTKETIAELLVHKNNNPSVDASNIRMKSSQVTPLTREMCQIQYDTKKSTDTAGETIILESHTGSEEDSETGNPTRRVVNNIASSSSSIFSVVTNNGKKNKKSPLTFSENKKCSSKALSGVTPRDGQKSQSRKVEKVVSGQQTKSEGFSQYRRSNSKRLPHKIKKTKDVQEVRTQSAVTSSNFRYSSQFAPYHPLPSKRRRPSTSLDKLSSNCGLENNGGDTPDDNRPWDVNSLRNMLHKKLGLYSSLEEYERDFYTKKNNEGLSSYNSRDDPVDRRYKRRATPRRPGMDPLPTDIRERYTFSSHRDLKFGISSSGSPVNHGYRSYHSSYRDGGWATSRLYDDFWSKWHKTQLFTELLNELRRDQRERERLSQGEMENQVRRMYGSSTRERRGSNSERVAGSARNYVLQQRISQNSQSRLKPQGKVEENESSFLFPQTPREEDNGGGGMNSRDGRRTRERTGTSGANCRRVAPSSPAPPAVSSKRGISIKMTPPLGQRNGDTRPLRNY
ncbi:hypothetical protein LSM04_004709 [Trypanosoma melophagium]|uniref:uncharacterized protein n=1 Tax=Trypanosoma melophagium TaxID=715481 RepID=UPI00351A59C2|nr:hypothetical protein LSM04_004709 [Trypanosoma melophagium]